MNSYVSVFIIIPILVLITSFIPQKNQEKKLFLIAFIGLSVQLASFIAFNIHWIFIDLGRPIFSPIFTYYRADNASFSIDFYYDKFTAVYALITSILGVLISIFSRYYMHRDPGFKRFYSNILFFFLGINTVIFAGNFETLFIGWEILGISSFLLIGFYRERYLPAKNALKVVSLFRLADVLLLVALWFCHQLFEKNINFQEMANLKMAGFEMKNNQNLITIISILFLLVAYIKSAQFPFSSWLPRAMEGPTTSSAIFYGSLSVHIGLYLMLRISPFWEENVFVRAIIISFGLLTAIFATFTAYVQSSVKTQIGYASIAQIGLMFVEIGFGFYNLALIHFVGNALLRSYQLLVSPSVLHYLIHHQFFNFIKPSDEKYEGTWGKLRTTIFMLSIKEWNLDRFQFYVLWNPFKVMGRPLTKYNKPGTLLFILLLILGSFVYLFLKVDAQIGDRHSFSYLFILLALLLVLVSFSERNSAKMAWLNLVLAQCCIVLTVSLNHSFDLTEILIYMSGVIPAGIVGFICLQNMSKTEQVTGLHSFMGHIYEHPKTGLVFLVACLCLAGFPITPTFIGLDIVFAHIHHNQFGLLILMSLSFVFIEIAALRIYSRVFLGQHIKVTHEMAFKHS